MVKNTSKTNALYIIYEYFFTILRQNLKSNTLLT